MDIFKDIVGHINQKKRLLILLKRRLLPSTILFAGPEGIGKFKLVERIVMSLHCKMENSPCLKCSDCIRIQHGLHPDSVLLYPNENDIIPIGTEANKEPNTVQWFLERLSMKAVGSVFTAIINGIDKMRPEAQNALLKTIEEPIGERYIFLIASNISTVLPTILSRSYILKFNALNDSEVIQVLEKYDYNNPRNDVIVEIAGGSMAIAIMLQKENLLEEIKKSLLDVKEQVETGFSKMENIVQTAKIIGGDYLLEVLANIYRKNLLWLLNEDKAKIKLQNFFGNVFFEEARKVSVIIKILMQTKIELKRNINLINILRGLFCQMNVEYFAKGSIYD